MFSWMVIERRPAMAARANITTESQRAQEMTMNLRRERQSLIAICHNKIIATENKRIQKWDI